MSRKKNRGRSQGQPQGMPPSSAALAGQHEPPDEAPGEVLEADEEEHAAADEPVAGAEPPPAELDVPAPEPTDAPAEEVHPSEPEATPQTRPPPSLEPQPELEPAGGGEAIPNEQPLEQEPESAAAPLEPAVVSSPAPPPEPPEALPADPPAEAPPPPRWWRAVDEDDDPDSEPMPALLSPAPEPALVPKTIADSMRRKGLVLAEVWPHGGVYAQGFAEDGSPRQSWTAGARGWFERRSVDKLTRELLPLEG